MKAEAEAEALRERERIQVEILQEVVNTLGHEGYLRREQIEHIAQINLPNTILGSTGLLDPLFAHIVGNITGQVPASEQPDATKLADRVIQFLQENPSELQVVLKRLTDQVHPAEVIETDTTQSLPRIPNESTIPASTNEALAAAVPPTTGSKSCPNCSFKMSMHAVFCAECGYRVGK